MLDCNIKRLLDVVNQARAFRKDWQTLPIDLLRESFARANTAFNLPAEAVSRIENKMVMGPVGLIPVRIYHPAPDQDLPVILYFHGGGFVIYNLETHDSVCRILANRSNCVVVAVDYRLAPEHKFPSALEDAEAILMWAKDTAHEWGGLNSNIGVVGDSAGGNISAVLSMLFQYDEWLRPNFQCLIYPMLDVRAENESRDIYANGFWLDRALVQFFAQTYMHHPSDARDERVSPALCKNLNRFPRTLIFSAGYDLLRDEAESFAGRLQKAGVPVQYKCFESLVHNFILLGKIPAAGAALNEIAVSIGEMAYGKLF